MPITPAEHEFRSVSARIAGDAAHDARQQSEIAEVLEHVRAAMFEEMRRRVTDAVAGSGGGGSAAGSSQTTAADDGDEAMAPAAASSAARSSASSAGAEEDFEPLDQDLVRQVLALESQAATLASELEAARAAVSGRWPSSQRANRRGRRYGVTASPYRVFPPSALPAPTACSTRRRCQPASRAATPARRPRCSLTPRRTRQRTRRH